MKKALLYSLLLLLLGSTGYSQKGKLEKANKQYERLAYKDAIKTYERIVEKGYKSAEIVQKLGNAYYFNGEFDQANKWYGELFALNANPEPEYYYRYAQTLKSEGQYDKANEMLTLFAQKNSTDSRATLFNADKDYLQDIKQNSGRYTIETVGINSRYSDYGASFYGDKIVFASSRDMPGTVRRRAKWTNQSFTNLYVSETKADGSLSKPKTFKKPVNSKFHESTPVFTKDGKTMYFTRNNYNKGKKGKDGEEVTLLKIYKAEFIQGKWENITELPFCSDNYSVAHPALSPDGKTLYFASNMAGSLGQSDIFKVAINEDGTFGEPLNLGNTINTEGKETFPFISENNELYFASDGRQGLGGFDIFVSKIGKDGRYQTVYNVGAPVNGPMDDFAFIIDTNTKTGYFSSNRSGGDGYDDIYRLKELTPIKFETKPLIAGKVTGLEDGLPIENAKVIVFDTNFKTIKEAFTDKDGHYELELDKGDTYYVRVEKEGFAMREKMITVDQKTQLTDLPFALKKRTKDDIIVGSDLAKAFQIDVIYFDLNKSNIRPDAAEDLGKIIDLMRAYPKIKIDVRSHTDSRASALYNLKLSNRRAKATMAYLIENGISPERITGKGYGETRLLNNCSDGQPCTEAQHQENRRSEFIITAM